MSASYSTAFPWLVRTQSNGKCFVIFTVDEIANKQTKTTHWFHLESCLLCFFFKLNRLYRIAANIYLTEGEGLIFKKGLEWGEQRICCLANNSAHIYVKMWEPDYWLPAKRRSVMWLFFQIFTLKVSGDYRFDILFHKWTTTQFLSDWYSPYKHVIYSWIRSRCCVHRAVPPSQHSETVSMRMRGQIVSRDHLSGLCLYLICETCSLSFPWGLLANNFQFRNLCLVFFCWFVFDVFFSISISYFFSCINAVLSFQYYIELTLLWLLLLIFGLRVTN